MGETRLQRVFIYVTVVIVCILLILPIYWMLVTSLQPGGEVLQYPPQIFPSNLSLEGYKQVFTDTKILRWFANSAFVTFFTLLLVIPIAALAGYSVSRFEFPGIKEAGFSILAIRMLPTTLLVVPLYLIFKNINLLNNLFSLVIANTSFIMPFAIWMLKGYFDSIPPTLEDAAQIDGCSLIGALFRVVIPLSAPGLAATTIYSAILSWAEFIFAYTFMSGSESWTLTVGISSFRGQYTTNWNAMMAMSMIVIIPIMILFIFLEKYLVSGLSAGAVKE